MSFMCTATDDIKIFDLFQCISKKLFEVGQPFVQGGQTVVQGGQTVVQGGHTVVQGGQPFVHSRVSSTV